MSRHKIDDPGCCILSLVLFLSRLAVLAAAVILALAVIR